MIWCVFYKVPEKFGLLRKLANGPRVEFSQEEFLQIETEDFEEQFIVQASPMVSSTNKSWKTDESSRKYLNASSKVKKLGSKVFNVK